MAQKFLNYKGAHHTKLCTKNLARIILKIHDKELSRDLLGYCKNRSLCIFMPKDWC